jgi:uroporphyrinogen-III synthase
MAEPLMRVLVTRPLDDALETARRLEAIGHEPIIAPLLEIRFRDGPQIVLDGVQAILATSANGIRALVRRTARRDVPVFAVGKRSAEEARAAGFTEVRNAEGGSAALARAAANWAIPQSGALLHISGEEIAGDLSRTLGGAGFDVRREVLYEAVAVDPFPRAALGALRNNALDAVLFFSARSSATFARCIVGAGLEAACENLIAVAISQAAAAPLSELRFRETRIPQRPTQDAMLALLG